MDTPICFSQNFVNKQNLRSFGNILPNSELKSNALQLFGDEENLKIVSRDLLYLLTEMKTNLRVKSRQDFKEHFEVDATLDLKPVNKQGIFKNTWNALCDIFPRKLFGGSNHNVKILREIVESAIFSMRRQHFNIERFIDKWDFSSPLWNTVDNSAKKILYFIFVWVLKYIISPIISLNFYVTTCKINSDENKLHYFWKHQWQSFYDKKISETIFTRVIKRCDAYCLGKKVKRNHNKSEWAKLRSTMKEIPKLHLIIKSNNNYRPIVQYKSNSHNLTEKYKIKERLNFLKLLTGKTQMKIEILYAELIKEWLRLSKPTLYFIKTDLSNAFGNVNKEILMKILSEKHITLQREEKNMLLKKKYAQQYRDMVMELRKPLLVRAGSTVYEWREGLVQGYKYSPALSELYYKHMDEIYFSEHFKNCKAILKLFTRFVDDYLYITDSLEEAHSFLKVLGQYKNVNYSKTEVNFHVPGITLRKEITFLGLSYNTENMQVGRASSMFVGQMCYKIAFTGAITDMNKFIENRIGQSGIPISSQIFNFWHNPEELIWRHIFTTFCLSANKFCTTLAILCKENEMTNYLILFKKKVVVKLSNSMIETLMKNKPVDFRFVFCINHFHYLAWKALYLCAKGTSICSILIPKINDELAKTNCLFGKWHQHASCIDTSGEKILSANKLVCRRFDLRMIVKEFDKLPEGFECYHQKILNETK